MAASRKKILIVNRKQFGYHIDTYYYSKYLSGEYDITYICWDYKEPRIDIEGVSVKYISREGLSIIRYLRFLWGVILEVNNDYDIYFLKYYFGCFLLKIIFPRKKYIFDVRTGSINKNRYKRTIADKILKFESLFFENITVISASLARKFAFGKKAHVLPLGSDPIVNNDKNFKSINLLYVGTLQNRHIENTVFGFARFYKEYCSGIDIDYKIIGSGYQGEEEELRKLIREKGLEEIIEVLGEVRHDELIPYFLSQNVGISYIPITDYFDCQPPTKTFEYALAGMPIIATATIENKIVINEFNGVLIRDTPDSFYEGLVKIMQNLENYESKKIRKSFEAYRWSNITTKNLKIFLEGIEGIQ